MLWAAGCAGINRRVLHAGRSGLMMKPTYNVLFLCTGNSARSIMAESLMDHWGAGRIKGYSAGSFPKGSINPLALQLLREAGMRTEGMRSKSWDEFATSGARIMDFVFTVCDQAAAEPCPAWPGQPITAHWGVPDPAAVDGSQSERMLAFRAVFRMLETRIQLLVALPIASLSKLAITRKVEEIGRIRTDTREGKAS
jgi:arsenate reductase